MPCYIYAIYMRKFPNCAEPYYIHLSTPRHHLRAAGAGSRQVCLLPASCGGIRCLPHGGGGCGILLPPRLHSFHLLEASAGHSREGEESGGHVG